MSHKPGDGFDGVPAYSFGLEEQPGAVEACVIELNKAFAEHPDFVNPANGVLYFNTPDGKTLKTMRTAITSDESNWAPLLELPQAEVAESETAAKGIKAWLQRFRKRNKQEADSRVSYAMWYENNGHEAAELNIETWLHGTWPTVIRGSTKDNDGVTTTFIAADAPLQLAAYDVLDVIRYGNPVPLEEAINIEQEAPCEEIIGEEAAKVQKVAERLVDMTTISNPNFKTQTATYKVNNLGVTNHGQWAVQSLTINEFHGVLDVDEPAVIGRTVQTTVLFSDETMNFIGGDRFKSQLKVAIDSTYDANGQPIATRVLYRAVDMDRITRPIAVNPDERQEIYEALDAQVVPENLTQTSFIRHKA